MALHLSVSVVYEVFLRIAPVNCARGLLCLGYLILSELKSHFPRNNDAISET